MADSIFTGLTPANPDEANSTPITLGTLFIPQVDGTITHLGWYAPVNPSGLEPVARLWRFNNNDSGTVLATQAGLASGTGTWAWVTLDTPVAVTAGQRYVVGVRAIRYCATNEFFTVADHTSPGGYLVGQMNAAGANNGRFADNDTVGDLPSYPTQTFKSTAYFIDVIFEPGTPPPVDVTVADRASVARALESAVGLSVGVTVADTASAPARALDGDAGLVVDTSLSDLEHAPARAINPASGVVIGPPPPSAGMPDQAIVPTLQKILALYRAESLKVADPPTYASIRPGVQFVAGQATTKQGVVTGDEACEGSIWVRVVNAYPTQNFPQQFTGYQNDVPGSLAVVVELGVARCVPYQGESDGTFPTSEQHAVAAGQIMADYAAMRRTYLRLRAQNIDAVMGQYQPIPSESNAGGGTMHITVRVPFCDQLE